MSDPDQSYGAVPPPPPGPQVPPPEGGGPGGRKGLWITLGALGVAVLAVVVVVLVLLVTGDDDDTQGAGDPGGGSTAAGASPEEVVEDVLAAAADDDCTGVEEHLTDGARELEPCETEEFRMLAAEDVETEVGEATVDGDRATVPATFRSAEGGDEYVFTLERVDDEWLVASYAPGRAGATDAPSGSPTGPTLTDSPSSGGAGASRPPGGQSTADSVTNEPEAVVEAFLSSVLAGDCATAEDLVTEDYLQGQGECDPADVPSGLADQVDYEVGTAKVDAAGTATVPVEITAGGSTQDTQVELTKVDGMWRISSAD